MLWLIVVDRVSVEEARACVAYQERLLAALTSDSHISTTVAPEAEDIPAYDDCPLLLGLEQRMDPIIENYVKVCCPQRLLQVQINNLLK